MGLEAAVPKSAHGAARDLLEHGFARLELAVEVKARLDRAYRSAATFFAEPADVRASGRLPHGCGHLPYGTEHSGEAARPDQIEGFAASMRTIEPAAELACRSAAALHAALIDVFDDLHREAASILLDIAKACGAPEVEGTLDDGLERWSLTQVHRARAIVPGAMINTPHEDGHLLTFAHATAPGLEIETQGVFAPVGQTDGASIVMPGSALTLMTGGAIAPLRHLVRSHPTARPRMSLMFFADLDPKLCRAWRTTPVNRGIDIAAHVLGNSQRFGAEGFPRE